MKMEKCVDYTKLIKWEPPNQLLLFLILLLKLCKIKNHYGFVVGLKFLQPNKLNHD